MKITKENEYGRHCAANCLALGVYTVQINGELSHVFCTEHAKELCSLEMPKGPKFIVSQHRYPGVPYCRHGTKESVVFRVTTEVENIVAEMLCEDCALAIVRTLEARQ